MFYQSKEWRSKSFRAKKLQGFRCQNCFRTAAPGYLHAHHVQKNYGYEHETELMVLCIECHRDKHGGSAAINCNPKFPPGWQQQKKLFDINDPTRS